MEIVFEAGSHLKHWHIDLVLSWCASDSRKKNFAGLCFSEKEISSRLSYHASIYVMQFRNLWN